MKRGDEVYIFMTVNHPELPYGTMDNQQNLQTKKHTVVPRQPSSPQPGPSHLLLSEPETDSEEEWPGMPPAPSPGTMPGQTEQTNPPPTACEQEASHV
ncbi:zinc finger homeobox protein 2-like [Ahaetulla prasina]|uniref:zinc finger homeobox protein 2-like n=1 Tax=Ahaetulla prasina TaxID=499056 RepID=UPI002649DC60|nr:zinc finger homeobox protein 2-like [Ahaetulla prasina]